MSNQVVVVADADAIIAQSQQDDANHKKAQEVSTRLVELNARVIYATTTIAEAATHMQRVLNNTASAYGTALEATTASMEVAEVNQQTLTTALRYFSPTTSKKNTFFDCIVAAVAEEKQADAIFSFDKFYTKKGFKLASEL
ncbi:MAG: PIN domain-containing protein [Patescibacteria group bacterium]